MLLPAAPGRGHLFEAEAESLVRGIAKDNSLAQDPKTRDSYELRYAQQAVRRNPQEPGKMSPHSCVLQRVSREAN